MSDNNIWSTPEIPKHCKDYLVALTSINEKANRVYGVLFEHLQTINLEKPSNMSTIIAHLNSFDEINCEADRVLLNLYIYVNTIRINHVGCSLQTSHTEIIMNLLQILSEQRRSLQSIDYAHLLDGYNEKKDKNVETYDPCLALLERKTFKNLLNGLVSIQMITNFVSKHLKKYEILDSVNVSLKSHNNHYM